ncbi:hypothetical protein [Microbacterium sp. JZ31]|uniref:hypothetical protein n=1 Tax=Microbacterium sp. JZ31 TaxID=1906274 RepID=UPI0019314ED5|nr:hypothetical protein [Microbacterium sp. JZ31]
MRSVRRVFDTIALAFTAYFAVRGLVRPEGVAHLPLAIVAVSLYLVLTLIALYVEQAREPGDGSGPPRERAGTVLPQWAAFAVLAGTALIPLLVSAYTPPGERTASHATWYLGAVGAVLTIVCARHRPVHAWIGIGVLAVESSLTIGLGPALGLGLVGSAVWVAIAQLLMIFTDRAYRDTARLAALQQATSAWQATQAVRRLERRRRVQYALAVAGPILSRVIAADGELTDEERTTARLAEGRLRDELRGALLLDDDVREAIAAARLRGATVTVFDEGGLDDLPPEHLDSVRHELADTLRQTDAARIIIRAAPDPDVAITIVGRSPGGEGLTEEDDLQLWREVPRPTAAS